MKKISIFLLATVIINSAIGQTIWDDFDNPENVVYAYHDGIGFDQMFINPATGGVNTSGICASYDRNPGVLYDVIVVDPAGTNVVSSVADYVMGTKTLSVKVYSPGPGLTVQITLEDKNVAGPTNYPVGRHSEYTATTTGNNAWETLTFTLVNTPDPAVSDTSITRMVLLFEPNTNNATNWLWDDLIGPDFIDPCQGGIFDPSIGDDFECQRNLNYTFTNGSLSTVTNPMSSSNNTSSHCGFFKKFPPPTNDGAFGGNLTTPFTTADYNRVHIDLYDMAAPQDFYVIVQDAGSSSVAEITHTTAASSDWQTYDLDLTGIPSSTQITNIVLLLNPATSTEDSIFIDNFRFSFDPSSISKQDLSSKTKIYPNPFADNFTISSTDFISTIKITDLTGKLIHKETPGNLKKCLINTAFLESGIYIITIQNNLGTSFSKELIKH